MSKMNEILASLLLTISPVMGEIASRQVIAEFGVEKSKVSISQLQTPSRKASVGVRTLRYPEGFERFRVTVYRGVRKPLRLSSDQRNFRTRLIGAYNEPINFGGSLVLTGIGCGAGCIFYTALDKSSGTALDFPLGGEENIYLQLKTRRDSALLWATWGSQYTGGCFNQPWVLDARGFSPLTRPTRKRCAV